MIMKSNPRVIPNSFANALLKSGKIANKLTIIQNSTHNITVNNEFFSFRYLNKNHTMAIMEIIGTKIEYNNIKSPFKIDV